MKPGQSEQGGELAIISSLFGALFLASVDNQLLIPLLPTLSREFSIPFESVGWLLSGYAFSAAAFNLVMGPLSDRYGRVVFLRFGLLFFAVLEVLTSFSETFAGLLILRCITGMVAGVLSTCTAGIIGDRFSYERRGRIMGIVLSSYFAALIFGVPLSALVAESLGWRTVFLISGSLAVAVLAGSLIAFRGEAAVVVQAGQRRRYRDILSDRQTAAALGVSFLVSGGTLAFLTYISGYLGENFGLGVVQISTVFVIAGVAAIVASPASGWVSDRWTKRRVFLVANTALAGPLLLLTVPDFGTALFLLIFLVSLAIAFRQTALQTLQTQLIPTQRRGAFLAIRNCFSQLGISLSVTAGGFVYAAYGYEAVTLLAAGLTLAGSVLLFLLIPEPGV